MKVKCINKGSVSTLTENKVYEIVSKSQKMFRIEGDDGEVRTYFRSRFSEVADDTG